MWVTDAQVKKMRSELDKHNNVSRAAMKADMDRKTARRYRDLGQLPSQSKAAPRTWRTRTDPFEEVWPEIELRLRDAPGLDAKTLFDDLVEHNPGVYKPGQLRTLQRKVKRFRATEGPEKNVFFAQVHRPGEAMQTDFTHCNELGITLCGVPFPHLLCHCVLPYSDWQWATICHSESLAALKRGVQLALQQLGGLSQWHQTDNSTAATHHLGDGNRAFNDEYLRWMEHLGMRPRTTAVGHKEQNGSVEALNGALKRRLEQHLLMRGSRDFDDKDDYQAFVHHILRKTNDTRGDKLVQERPLLRPLPSSWFPDYVEDDITVTSWSTIRVSHNTYSVPSRLIGETVRVHIYDEHIEVFYANNSQLVIERLRGRFGHHIDYRHVVWSLIRKPGAFARYRYREDLFPSLAFRRAYDALAKRFVERNADLEYIRILHLAASTFEADVQAALLCVLEAGTPFDAQTIRALVQPQPQTTPRIEIGQPCPASYDRLLVGVGR